MSTTKDSTVMEFGGIVVKEVTETRDSVGGTIKKIENIETRNSGLMKPVLSMYFFFIITLLVILAISLWYYVKSFKTICSQTNYLNLALVKKAMSAEH